MIEQIIYAFQESQVELRYNHISMMRSALRKTNCAIHKAAGLRAPSRSMALTGTIPVELKMSIGCEWELTAGIVSKECLSATDNSAAW